MHRDHDRLGETDRTLILNCAHISSLCELIYLTG
jgi:hypothetical protein